MRNFIHLDRRSALGSAMGLALNAQASRQPHETTGVSIRRNSGREPRTLGMKPPAAQT